jgi:uncharacterized membrane protein YfcA
MKIIGWILIIIGLLMLVQRSIQYTKKEKVVDVGSVEITKKEPKMITWPFYAGVIVMVAGIVFVVVDSKKTRH